MHAILVLHDVAKAGRSPVIGVRDESDALHAIGIDGQRHGTVLGTIDRDQAQRLRDGVLRGVVGQDDRGIDDIARVLDPSHVLVGHVGRRQADIVASRRWLGRVVLRRDGATGRGDRLLDMRHGRDLVRGNRHRQHISNAIGLSPRAGRQGIDRDGHKRRYRRRGFGWAGRLPVRRQVADGVVPDRIDVTGAKLTVVHQSGISRDCHRTDAHADQGTGTGEGALGALDPLVTDGREGVGGRRRRRAGETRIILPDGGYRLRLAGAGLAG
ncbi:hypothetical protein FQZ97_715250 [compost metagenome]